MIDNDQITALAREYAEEIVDHKRLSTTVADDTEDVIRFLLRRFYLVEKNRVEKEYKKTCESVNKHSATTGCLFFVGQKQTLESLFPEIAKEVEE